MFLLILILVIALQAHASRHVTARERKPHRNLLAQCMVLGWRWAGFALRGSAFP